MNKQVNRVTNAIADDIRSHERSQKIYSLCFLAVLLLPLLLVFVSYVLGAHQLPSLVELVSSKLAAMLAYVTIVTLVMSICRLDKRVARCIQKIIKLQKELDKSKDKNGELQDALAESEHKRKEAEALAKAYEKMLSKEQRDIAEALAINAANRSR